MTRTHRSRRHELRRARRYMLKPRLATLPTVPQDPCFGTRRTKTPTPAGPQASLIAGTFPRLQRVRCLRPDSLPLYSVNRIYRLLSPSRVLDVVSIMAKFAVLVVLVTRRREPSNTRVKFWCLPSMNVILVFAGSVVC